MTRRIAFFCDLAKGPVLAHMVNQVGGQRYRFVTRIHLYTLSAHCMSLVVETSILRNPQRRQRSPARLSDVKRWGPTSGSRAAGPRQWAHRTLARWRPRAATFCLSLIDLWVSLRYTLVTINGE